MSLLNMNDVEYFAKEWYRARQRKINQFLDGHYGIDSEEDCYLGLLQLGLLDDVDDWVEEDNKCHCGGHLTD